MTGRLEGTLPTALVIGAMKAGTTALHYYLDLHPEVSMSRPKELNYFVDEPVSETEVCSLTREELSVVLQHPRNGKRGLDWYMSQFDGSAAVHGEASPEYTSPWYPYAAQRMAAVVPEAKLVFIVRDPIERAIKDYLTLHAVGWDSRGPESALGAPRAMYIGRSRYYSVLKPYLELFGAANVLVLSQEELRSRRRETMRTVYAYLGVDDSFWDPRLERERNPTTARPRKAVVERVLDRTGLRTQVVPRLPSEAKWVLERAFLRIGGRASQPNLSTEIRDRMAEALRPEVAELRAVTGKRFPDWSI